MEPRGDCEELPKTTKKKQTGLNICVHFVSLDGMAGWLVGWCFS